MSTHVLRASYWANFPVTYRLEQVATITRWVLRGESGVVVGGSGTGKSNLAGFLSSRPDAVAPHLHGSPDEFLLLRLDINSLPLLTAPFFYRGLIQTLQDAAAPLDPELQPALQALIGERPGWDDLFFVLTTLQNAHELVIRQTGRKIVWLLDRFDEACQQLDAQVLSSLRSLRDRFKGRLCYAVFTRQPLARLRNPGEIDEFHEIVAANTCRVGPMNERDSRWIVHQMAGRLGRPFSEPEVRQLLAVTGGLPAFLKLACLALADGAVDAQATLPAWSSRLLSRSEFRRNCQEIWGDLSDAEQTALLALNGGAGPEQLDQAALAYLQQTGLLVSDPAEGSPRLFSPIFGAFISQRHGAPAGALRLEPKTQTVLRGDVPLEIELTAQELLLLSDLLAHPAEVRRKDDLIRAVWPDEAIIQGVRDDRLAQLVKRLRQKIEPDPANPTYIQTVRGQGYRLVQPD